MARFQIASCHRARHASIPNGTFIDAFRRYPLEYRDVSAAGTIAETLERLKRRTTITRNLAIPRTTGMPHRPASSDGHTSIFVSSNPTGRR